MSCPGQDPNSLFFFTLKNSPQFLNPNTPLPYSSQFKCYDGMAILNQVQPAPYDGMYKFPSITGTIRQQVSLWQERLVPTVRFALRIRLMVCRCFPPASTSSK